MCVLWISQLTIDAVFHTTFQKRLFHGLHESFQVVLHIVHDDVDPVHVATHNKFLETATITCTNIIILTRNSSRVKINSGEIF